MAFLFGLLGIAALIIYVVIAAGPAFLILPPVVHFIDRHADDPVATWITRRGADSERFEQLCAMLKGN